MNTENCTSCKKSTTNSEGTARFKCPSCKSYTIIRCQHCRKIAAAYSCPDCGFTGPN